MGREIVRLDTAGDLQQELEGRSILVVDDEAVIRELCSKALKGYRVLQASDGDEALRLLEQQPVDLLLTDVMMPRLNGLDLLKTIKEREPILPVVVMTGYADKEIILRALKADADDFINKPINLLQLKTTIDKVLEKKVLKEELLQLKRMDRLKSDFLGLVSHKLKTPTTAISLFIQNLADNIGDPSSPEFRQNLQMILEESQHLDYLIKDLLFYSQVILGDSTQNPDPVNLRELALSVLSELKPSFAKRQQKLMIDLPNTLPELALDRKQIAFALQSLLENALKFTPQGGSIALSGWDRSDSVTLTVSDTGPGMPAEELAKVFEKFYQVDPGHTGQVRGFGLGLFYARQFVQNHGGRLVLESTPGDGTRAIIELPRR